MLTPFNDRDSVRMQPDDFFTINRVSVIMRSDDRSTTWIGLGPLLGG